MRNYIIFSTVLYGIMAILNVIMIISGHNSQTVIASLNIDFTIMFIGICAICILNKLDEK